MTKNNWKYQEIKLLAILGPKVSLHNLKINIPCMQYSQSGVCALWP